MSRQPDDELERQSDALLRAEQERIRAAGGKPEFYTEEQLHWQQRNRQEGRLCEELARAPVGPLGMLEDWDELDHLFRAAGVSTEQRAVYVLKVLSGWTYPELGRILGVSGRTAQRRVREVVALVDAARSIR